jgi:hypothetical protein
MTTPKYSYKGSDISNLISSGTTSLTNYSGFPSYIATNYSIEKPLPFNIFTPTEEVSTLMTAKVFTDTTFDPYSSNNPGQPALGGSSYTPPADFNMFRAVIIGGGGASGNGGACGFDGFTRFSGGSERAGGYGNVTVVEGALNISGKFWYGAGQGGNEVAGKAGPGAGVYGNGKDGGTGNYGGYSYLSYGNGIIYANGGEGGGGGKAGEILGTINGCHAPVNLTAISNTQPSAVVTIPPIIQPSPTNTVAYFTSSNIPPLQYGNVYGQGGPGNGTPGLIQIYLLKS